MNFGKVKAVFFILVFILVLALVVNAALELDAKRHPQVVPADTEETESLPTAEPTPEPPPVQQQSAPAYPTVPTPVPANHQPAQQQQQQQQQQPQQQQQQQTAPTPPPTQPPMPVGQNLGSGGFSSSTGTGLELHCDWSAVSIDNNRAEITLKISATSYAISLNDMGENVYLRVGDNTASLAQPQMNHDGGAIDIPFGTRTFTVNLSQGANSFPVAVEWHYNGTYHQVQLDVIECGGTITLNR